MTQKTDKGKRQFGDHAAVKIGKPQIAGNDSYFYEATGPEGATEKHVKVNTDPKPRAPRAAIPAEQRAAERAGTKGSTYELRNMRATLVTVGPSVLNGRGVLMEIGNLVHMLAKQAEKAPSPVYMRKLMRLARPNASQGEIDEAVSICLQRSPYVPTRRSIGEAIGLDADVWEASDSPAYIWPFNRADDWVVAALNVKAAIKKAARQRRYRAKKKKPRKVTKGEIAAAMGISRMELWRRERAAGEAHVTKSGDAVRRKETHTVAQKCNSAPEPAPRAPASKDATAMIPDGKANPTDTEAAAGDASSAAGRGTASSSLNTSDHAPCSDCARTAEPPAQPPAAPSTDTAADAGDGGQEPSQAFLAAMECVRESLDAGDGQPSPSYLLWFAARNAAPEVPQAIMAGDDAGLGRHMLNARHLTAGELAWIMDPERGPEPDRPARPSGEGADRPRAVSAPHDAHRSARPPAGPAGRTLRIVYSAHGRRAS